MHRQGTRSDSYWIEWALHKWYVKHLSPFAPEQAECCLENAWTAIIIANKVGDGGAKGKDRSPDTIKPAVVTRELGNISLCPLMSNFICNARRSNHNIIMSSTNKLLLAKRLHVGQHMRAMLDGKTGKHRNSHSRLQPLASNHSLPENCLLEDKQGMELDRPLHSLHFLVCPYPGFLRLASMSHFQ